MEEVNEMALAELVNETIQESDFDYSDVTQEEKNRLLQIKSHRGVIVYNTVKEIGRDLKEAQTIYSKNGYGKFQKWVIEEYGMKYETAQKYLQAYNVIEQNEKLMIQSSFTGTNLLDLGVAKTATLAKLSKQQQEDILVNAPLNEMNYKEVNELTRKVKEKGEYNETLLNEIRQKDDKIKTSEAETKQLQQEKEQKDQEIAELKAKLQKIEEEKMQPVAQVEPEVVEKIVEVEKVVEKEVVPEKIKQELETYKELAQQKQGEIPDYILDELDTLRKTVNAQDEQLKNAKRTVEAIATQQNSKFGTQNIDWGLLGNVINSFLSKASEYTYMKEAFKIEDGKSKNFVKEQVDKIENWVIEMKRMMNTDLMIGNTIYVESNNTEIVEEEN